MNRRLRLLLLRWHRRLGVFIALVLVMLVVTGIALNHSDELALDQQAVRQNMILQRYGIELPELVSFDVNGRYLSLVGSNRLFLDNEEIAYCEAPLHSALSFESGFVAVCRDQLLLLSNEGEIIERLSEAYGLPANIQALGQGSSGLWLRTETGDYAADLNGLQFLPGTAPDNLQWPQPVRLNQAFGQQLTERYLGNDVHWERVLLDLHTGRLFGRWGVYVVDAAAIGLLLLSLSGVWVWLTKPGRWR